MSPPALPTPALVLGAGGLIPFLAPALILWLGPVRWHPVAVLSLMAYGAVILGFLGAVHWGLALGGTLDSGSLWRRLGWGVIPALLAWAALLLEPTAALWLLLAGFAVQYGVDYGYQRRGLMPGWYGRLRLWLTLGVAASLLAALSALS